MPGTAHQANPNLPKRIQDILHKDPFDRIEVPPNQAENLGLSACDRRIARYAIETVWS